MPGRHLRLVIPLIATGLLLWGMVGCFYLPVGEHVQLTGARRDFRPLASGVIYPGRITRAAVRAVLGPPAVQSENRRVEAYALTTHSGVWVMPLCFSVVPDDRHQFLLGLRYDADGRLERYRLVDVKMYSSVGIVTYSLAAAAGEALRRALRAVDADNGVVLATGYQHEQHPPVPDVRPEFAVGGRDVERLIPTTQPDGTEP